MSNKNEILMGVLFFTEKQPEGYPIKKYPLKKWIYENHYTLRIIAEQLNVPVVELKRKIAERDLFEYYQIKRLIYFMGAEAAFHAIYFPTTEMRKQVWYEVFGKTSLSA